MATLVLSAVGTVVGGPIGGAIGAIIGGVIDRNVLFRPKGREGPRLNDLALQSSTYGAPIGRVFGTMRVAGSVIWSTDLIERSSTEGGGKGRGSSTSYSYSASFAVLLSGRPVRDVRRIWADGKLLRGSAGDFKVATGFRLHSGAEDQPVDPLIAAAEGIGAAPAHRGCAYAVFEDMALEDYGNRIPSLTFEVVADDDAVSVGAIIEELADGAVQAGEAATPLAGYCAYGDSLRGVIDALIAVDGAWIAHEGAGLSLHSGEGEGVTIVDAGAGAARGVRTIASADAAPKLVTLAHHDPARDYQTGVQRAERPGAGTRALRVELPAVIAADTALGLATAMLARAERARERRVVTLDWRSVALPPGARVRIAGEPGLWRIAGWALDGMALRLELVRVARATQSGAAAAGRAATAADVAHGPTILHAFEIPPTDDRVLATPRLTIAAAGASPGWRHATLNLSIDGGARWTPIGRTRGAATLGVVDVAPGAGPASLVDRVATIEVTLANDAMTLADADDAAIDAGANLALVGDELVQFARAERLGARRWRLRGLWRGRRGTEWAAGAQRAGDRFVLLAPATMLEVELPVGVAGTTVTVLAAGLGDGDGVEAGAVATGASVTPPSPVHLRATATSDGGAAFAWTRRSRGGWRWIDGVDAPLGEETEGYAIEIDGATATSAMPVVTLPARPARVAVRQIGAHGASRPSTIAIDTQGDEG